MMGVACLGGVTVVRSGLSKTGSTKPTFIARQTTTAAAMMSVRKWVLSDWRVSAFSAKLVFESDQENKTCEENGGADPR